MYYISNGNSVYTDSVYKIKSKLKYCIYILVRIKLHPKKVLVIVIHKQLTNLIGHGECGWCSSLICDHSSFSNDFHK